MTIEAIVVKKMHIREHDLAVTLYSRELGKCSAVARSAMKPRSVQAPQLDVGNVLRCELIVGRGAPIITAAQATRCFSRAKASPVRWAAAMFFLQVIDAVVYDEQPDETLFACLRETLSELDEGKDAEALPILRRQQGNMLHALGYGATRNDTATGMRVGRTDIDDTYERIAQRTFGTIDFFYDLVRR